MTQPLSGDHCVACRRDAEPLTPAEVARRLAQVPGWRLAADGRSIEHGATFRTFADAFALVCRIASLAEAEGHHPDIDLGWGYVTVRLQTYAIGALHRNDFIMAARITDLVAAGPRDAHEETPPGP